MNHDRNCEHLISASFKQKVQESCSTVSYSGCQLSHVSFLLQKNEDCSFSAFLYSVVKMQRPQTKCVKVGRLFVYLFRGIFRLTRTPLPPNSFTQFEQLYLNPNTMQHYTFSGGYLERLKHADSGTFFTNIYTKCLVESSCFWKLVCLCVHIKTTSP